MPYRRMRDDDLLDLWELEERLGRIGAFRHDLGRDHYTWSPGARHLLGLGPGQEVGLTDVLARIPAGEREAYAQWRRQAVAGGPRTTTIPFDSFDGRDMYLELHIEVIDERLSGIVRDVTEQTKVRREQQALLDLMARAEETASFGLWEHTVGTPHVRATSMALALMGLPAEGPVDLRRLLSAIHADDARTVLAAYGRALESDFLESVTFRLAADPRQWRTIEARAAEGRPGAGRLFSGVIRDSTAQVRWAAAESRAQELADRDEERSILVSSIAHELAQPLTPLRFQAALMDDPALPPLDMNRQDALRSMRHAIDRVDLLMHDLLDATRLQAGRLKVRMSPLDLTPLLEAVHGNLEPVAQQAGVELEARMPSELWVQADPLRVQQVHANLVGNAVKFTPSGHSVSIEASSVSGSAAITVADEGVGIDDDVMPKLFEPFVQGPAAPRGERGTGLGLYICKGLVGAMGGSISAASPGPGKGSVFRWSVPLQTERQGRAADDASPHEGTS